MNFSLYIAKRYLISKNGKNAINLINALSFLITIIGTAALFLVLSGFSGLKEFSLEFTNYFDPDLKITAVEGKSISYTDKKRLALLELQGITVISPTIEEKIFLNYDSKNAIAILKGVPANYQSIVKTDEFMLAGNWLTGNDFQVVVGAGIANTLSLTVNNYGELLQIMVPKPGKGSINAMNMAQSFNIFPAATTGLYAISESLDNQYVFSTLTAAQKLLDYSDEEVTSLELKLAPEADEDELRKKINVIFNNEVLIKNKLQLNDALYKMLNSENIAVYLIFTLVLIIALFNVVGSIIMTILDKKKNLKTLRDLGASLSEIRKVFFYLGSLMSIIGGLIGLLVGFGIVLFQVTTETFEILPGIAYPMKIEILNMLIALATTAVLGIAASYVASTRITDSLLSYAKL